MNYYNDNDPKACAWLRELIAAGELSPGDVDCRSILEVKPDELSKYDQCHFFAGIGGWPLALRWAGLEGVPGIWTGSCPCQPFSCAGRGKGTEDERHLWPVFRDLIRACRPAVVFGEQVASAAVVGAVRARACAEAGTVWLDGVRGDMESAGYAFGAAVLGAHSVGAPHRRQRLYWVADCIGAGLEGHARYERDGREPGRIGAVAPGYAAESGGTSGVADGIGARLAGARQGQGDDGNGTDQDAYRIGRECESADGGGMGDAEGDDQRRNRQSGQGVRRQEPFGGSMLCGDYHIIHCRDGKARRIPAEPALFPLAHGLPGRVGLLRGAGNAIVPQCAAEFVMAWAETQNAPRQTAERSGDSLDADVGGI